MLNYYILTNYHLWITSGNISNSIEVHAGIHTVDNKNQDDGMFHSTTMFPALRSGSGSRLTRVPLNYHYNWKENFSILVLGSWPYEDWNTKVGIFITAPETEDEEIFHTGSRVMTAFS